MELHAYAKLNLTMEILGKREDGYHEIRSVMQFVDLCDTLEITTAEKFDFWCDDPALCNRDNLAVRAFRLMESQFDTRPVSIRLHKRIPYKSGLGGGSADAAMVLVAVNRLSGLKLTREQLMELGKGLGADVPACLLGGVMLAQGIGERLTPMPQRKPMYFNVIMPTVSFSTPEMYARMDEIGTFVTPQPQEQFLKAVRDAAPAAVASGLQNSFEAVAQPQEAITGAKRLLQLSGAAGASMTGAGSAVFGIYLNKEAAARAHQYIASAGVQVFSCHSVAGHSENENK